MARPIEPTPVLYGEDAERLLADLAKPCASDKEMAQRTKIAREYLAQVNGDGIRLNFARMPKLLAVQPCTPTIVAGPSTERSNTEDESSR